MLAISDESGRAGWQTGLAPMNPGQVRIGLNGVDVLPQPLSTARVILANRLCLAPGKSIPAFVGLTTRFAGFIGFEW